MDKKKELFRIIKGELKMKRKTLTLVLCLLSCLALIGVGFASWIITSNTEQNAEGNISVDTVTDNRLTVETSWLDEKNSIVFGWKDGSYTNSWLQNTDPTYKENLTVTLVVTVKNSENVAVDAQNITAKIIGDEKYTTAQAANLVGTLPTLTAEKQEATGVYHITITLTWGSAFNNQNPLEYYNNQEYETELANNAKTNLTALEALKDSKFTVTLTVTPNETN